MSNPVDARRRWFGLFFLFIAIGLLIWGQTILKPYLDGLLYVFYWLACFAFTFLALLTAMIDMWIVRRRLRAEQRGLINQAIGRVKAGDAVEESSDPTGNDPKRRDSH